MSDEERDAEAMPSDAVAMPRLCRPSVQFTPLGDSALIIQFGDRIDLQVHGFVRALSEYLTAHPVPGVLEYTPAFTTVCVFYDPRVILFHDLCAQVQRIVAGLPEHCGPTSRVVEIPVCYGGQFGPDLAFVAQHNQLTEEEAAGIHAGGEYLTYMIGFAPGFPYLGGMSDRICAPRRTSPRMRVPAGSVGIAGHQTGVYPIETPGGWQLIGRTPARLFRPMDDPPSLLRAGDVVRFRAIPPAEFQAWQEAHP